MAQPPRLYADVMLGRLSRALRFVGLDTLHGPPHKRRELLDQAILTGRTILTRDSRLATYGCRKLLIRSDRWDAQLEQVLDELAIDRAALTPFSRCSICNRPVVEVDREEIRARVHPYTFETYDRFYLCRGCDRVYWPGSHVRRFQERLTRFLRPDPTPAAPDRPPEP